MAETVKIFGIKELDEFFSGLARADQRQVFADAFREGSKPLIETAVSYLRSRMKTHSRTKNLEQSIGFVPIKGNSNSVFVSAKVGARRFGQYRGFHGHLFDAGTVQRSTRAGLNRGTMPATRFFSDALSATESQVSDNSREYLIAALKKQIDKAIKQPPQP